MKNKYDVISQIKPSTIEQGLKTILSADFGELKKLNVVLHNHYTKLSWSQSTSYLRRVSAPATDDTTHELTTIRQVYDNQCQFLCCVETPEGSNLI